MRIESKQTLNHMSDPGHSRIRTNVSIFSLTPTASHKKQIIECFYKENHNIPFKDSPLWPYFRNRKRTLFHAVPEQFQYRRIFLGLTSRCCRHGEQNRIQHSGLLGEDFFASKALGPQGGNCGNEHISGAEYPGEPPMQPL